MLHALNTVNQTLIMFTECITVFYISNKLLASVLLYTYVHRYIQSIMSHRI